MIEQLSMFEISPFRKDQIRLQVRRAIKSEPTIINIKRDIISRDKYKGKKRTQVDVITEEVFINYRVTSRRDLNQNIPDGNVVELKTLDLYAVYTPQYELRFGDYFILDGMKHIIKFPKNHNDIYWHAQVTVEVNRAEIEGE